MCCLHKLITVEVTIMLKAKPRAVWQLLISILFVSLVVCDSAPSIGQTVSDRHRDPILKYATNGLPPLACYCQDCQYTCDLLIDHCLHKGGAWSKPDKISILRDCSDICQMSANLVSRHSKFAKEACALCSAACIDVQAVMADLPEDQSVENYLKDVHQCETECSGSKWFGKHPQ